VLRATYGTLMVGIIKGGFAALWLFDAYPIDWLGEAARWQQWGLIFICWLGTTLSIGIPFVWIGGLGYLLQRYVTPLRVLIFPLLFISAEYAGAVLFSLYTYSEAVGVNAHFGFGMLGYVLAQHALLRTLSVFGGVFVLTGTHIVLASLLLDIFVRTPLRYRSALLIGAMVVYIGTGYIPISNRSAELTVASVGTRFEARASIPHYELHRRQQEILKEVKAALALGAQVVVLPEDARLGYGDQNLFQKLQHTPHTKDAVVVDSYRTDVSSSSVVLRGYIYDIDRATTHTSDKQYMVPMGEFLPSFHTMIVRKLRGMHFFDAMRYIPGTHEVATEAPASIPHMLFCFESSAPTIARYKTEMRNTTLIAHPVSHAWFHTPGTLWYQEQNMLIVQSIYTGLPILQAGNNAPSVLYTPDGAVHTGVTSHATSRTSLHFFTL
jgi:apolipoprotein N-acyltransferase